MRWLPAVVPLAFVACSYPEFAFSGSPPADTAADESAVVDTGGPTREAAVDDTALPTDAPDTARAEDSSGDTRDAADTATPVGCAAPHAFCANFDLSTTPATGFSGNFGSGAATLALTTMKFVSPTKSLIGTVTPSSATASAMVTRDFEVASPTAVTRFEANLMLSALTYGGPGDLTVLKLQRSSAGDGVAITIGPDGVQLTTTGTTSVRYALTGLTAGTWFRVRIDAVLHTTNGSAKLWIDDMTTPKLTRTGVSTAEVDDKNRQLASGVFSWMGSSGFTVYLDDISID